MDQIDVEKYDTIVVVTSKEEVDSSDYSKIVEFYDSILLDAIKFENKLFVMIEGYDDDPRELYEIEEVRNYFVVLDKLFPYWFYFLAKNGEKSRSPLGLVTSLLVPIVCIQNESKRKEIEFDMVQFLEFLKKHFYYLNELTSKLGLSDDENRRISMEVKEQFSYFL